MSSFGEYEAPLPAGDLLVYPSASIYEVTPVTRGALSQPAADVGRDLRLPHSASCRTSQRRNAAAAASRKPRPTFSSVPDRTAADCQ